MDAASTETKLLYMTDSSLLEERASVIAVEAIENGQYNVILDKTIFYPQGGGQPYDLGTMQDKENIFTVTAVRMNNGLVHHMGTFNKQPFAIDAIVHLHVDGERRKLNRRLHSAGHVIDVAVQNLGLKLVPTKGYHFPEGPYVEYEGGINEPDRESIRSQIEAETQRLVAAGSIVQVEIVPKDRLLELCGSIPDYIREDRPIRVVTVAGKIGCPCGGTHVKNVSEIGPLKISKIRVKGNTARISYVLV